jgi:signal transduction histidine kinase
MIGVRAFFASMTGRIFVILAVGMAAAALIAASLTIVTSERDFLKQQQERAADRIEGSIAFLDALPADVRANVISSGGIGLRIQPATVKGVREDADLNEILRARGGVLTAARARIASWDVCFPELRTLPREEMRRLWESAEVRAAVERLSKRYRRPREPQTTNVFPPICRLVDVTLTDGSTLRYSFDTPWVERERSRLLDPAFIVLLVLAIGILAYVVARIASTPLKKLSAAAAELGQNLDRPPITVSGPTEVRHAADAFNAMQRRLQEHVGDRTRMLAAITHDLQTPLTRLRLRLERVDDEQLRERLVADLAAMKALIDEGLELARSADAAEPRVMLDLDSLLESLVEDAVDAGGIATFEGGCGAVLPLRALAARRLFSNLIDNALKYGGSASVSASRTGNEISVRIRDHGPGLPPDMMERVFAPFVRVEDSRSRQSGGVGLGLTIARTLAERDGATLTLRNHPEGGLEATVLWPSARHH